MSSIEFIYFDLGKVILDFDHEKGCQQVSMISGISPERVRQAVFDSGLQNKFETGLITGDKFHAEFCSTTLSQPGKADFLRALSDIFEPKHEVLRLIARLTECRFPIGILSNTCSAHWDLIESCYPSLPMDFGPLILSYEVRSMKPDPVIYERAIEMAGCRANACFFVDDKQENVDGAIAAGMDAVLFHSVPRLVQELAARGVVVDS